MNAMSLRITVEIWFLNTSFQIEACYMLAVMIRAPYGQFLKEVNP